MPWLILFGIAVIASNCQKRKVTRGGGGGGGGGLPGGNVGYKPLARGYPSAKSQRWGGGGGAVSGI